MSMRVKTTVLIIIIVFFATAGNFFSSLYFTNNSLKSSLEQELAFAIGIADSLVSTKMHLIKADSATLAGRLARAGSAEAMTRLMAKMMTETISDFPAISALSVFDRSGVIASYSVPAHDHALAISGKYLEMVYGGATIISTPFHCAVENGYVINVYTPMERGRVLAVSIPGSTFNDLLAKHRLWKTGNIFMLNEEGLFVGEAHQEIVLALSGRSADGRTALEHGDAEINNLIQKMLSVDSGVDAYRFQGEERLCAYSRIDGSMLGWRVAVTVPLSESPQGHALKGHLYAAVFSMFIGAAAAFFLSRLTARPFKEIEAQNLELEKMNATIRERAAKMLEEHERVKALLDANPLAIRLWSRGSRLFECNEAAVKLFGLTSKQEYLERYFELSPEYQPDGQRTREKARALVVEAFEKGTCACEWMYQLPDGTPLPCEVTMVRIPYGDDYVVAGYSRDLREQKKMMAEIRDKSTQLEAALVEAKAASHTKSAFLAQMSHEIRTPLNAVVGLSELALSNLGLEEEMADKLAKIHGAGLTILSIVNDILDISKIESGKFELFKADYDTPSLINDIVTLNVVRIGEKPIVFKLGVDENLPGALHGDDLRVKQVFNNLLSNAFKYTNEGEVEWRVSHERDEEGVWLVSIIRDTGIGIRPKELRNIFSEYNQVDMEANRKVEGTGLGLPIAKRLVEMMDGSIAVESEYGRGTTFRVRLRQGFLSDAPIGREVAENLMSLRYALSRRAGHAHLSRVNLSYAHVLAVDDIATNLDVVKGMMKPYGVKIDCAMSGYQAIEMIRGGEPRYSAVFMDHMMPGLDGLAATRIIREEIGTDYAKNVPIIALTANAIVGNEEMFLNNGFQDFISKPIDMMKLDSVLRRWVRDKALEKELGAAGETAGAAPSDSRPGETGKEKSVAPDLAIDGLDTHGALERFSGDEEVLVSVLRSYAAGTRRLLNDLNEYLAAEKLDDYAIAVHGIKGSSYGICAREAGRMAEDLEISSKAGDADAVRTGHGAFEKKVKKLLEAIDGVLSKIDDAADKPLASAPAPELLRELREACETFDMDRVDAAMAGLETARYENGGELVAWLRARVDAMAFEEISNVSIDALLARAGPAILKVAGRAQRDGA